MIIDNGNIDFSLDASYLAAPEGIDWPAPIKKALADYEAIWQAWADADTELQTLIADRGNAPALDGELMRTAVRAKKPDPGTPNQDKAARAVIYAKESVRQTATTARAVADKIRTDIAEHSTMLIPAAINLERARLQTLIKAQQAIQVAWAEAQDEARNIGTTLNWLLDNQGDGSYRSYRIEFSSPTVNWPAPYELTRSMLTQRLDALERTLTPQPPIAKTSENSFDTH
jgi:hypothetical protein